MRKFSLQDWASIAEIFGAAAIVISLIYVAYEIRENTKALQVASRQALAAGDLIYFQTAIDPSIVAQGIAKRRQGVELSYLEESQLIQRQNLNYRIFEHAASLNRMGALEPVEWERYSRIIQNNICNRKDAQEMWDRGHKSYDPEFVEIVDNARRQCSDVTQ
jgi:hypothetical protein